MQSIKVAIQIVNGKPLQKLWTRRGIDVLDGFNGVILGHHGCSLRSTVPLGPSIVRTKPDRVVSV
jgi:hypothetical protein